MTRSIIVNRGPSAMGLLAVVLAVLKIIGMITLSWFWIILIALFA